MSGTTYQTTPVTVTQFRTDQAAFFDPNVYSDNVILLYLNAANQMFDPNRWGELWVMGVELWTAHFVTLMAQAQRAANNNSAPGMTPGMVASKGIGPASMSYDGSSAEDGAGQWNMTSYGRMFIHFARLVGAPGMQFVPCGPAPGNWFPGSGEVLPLDGAWGAGF